MTFPRCSGILLHPTSLPGTCGIGDLSDAAYRFVDFLHEAGMSVWQMLPLGPTGAANSPYQCLSSFAGNPLLVSLEALKEERLLGASDLLPDAGFLESWVVFDKVRSYKETALRKAYAAFEAGKCSVEFTKKFETFRAEEQDWLEDFALFVALKEKFGGKAWPDWPEPGLISRDEATMKKYRVELAAQIRFHCFVQFLFFTQWRKLKKYANDKGIKLMGDVPIYVAHDSADVWASPEYFELDAKGGADKMAGVPPDYFSPTGQLWGNPIYNWKKLKADNYKWWVNRINATLTMVDMLRIDHFRGFEAYWEVPAGEKTAVNGKWIKGPGAELFAAVRKELGALPIIAEDLGTITPEVHALREGEGFPGMKVLQFGFCDGAEFYLPHTYEKNAVVYTATHDNDTTKGWYLAQGHDYEHHDRGTIERERDKCRRYLARDGADVTWDLIRLALQSVADIAIFPMQDVLDLGNEFRMNRPGVTDGQWAWRLTAAQLASARSGDLREMNYLYDRIM